MKNKGSTNLNTKIEIPNDFNEAGKPFKSRVDINVLKSKIQDAESREFKKNLIILILLFTMLGVLGINLSL